MKKQNKQTKKQYKAKVNFKSTINAAEFVCKKGDIIELNAFEHSILYLYVEEIQ